MFEAVIVPHRSLSPRGLRDSDAVIGALCALIVLRFWLIGAWPVAGFGVVEIGLAIFLLRLNASRARAQRADSAVRTGVADCAHRPGTAGGRSGVLPIGWLNAVIEEPAGKVPRLLLVARGVREEIATTLGEVEKRDLWAALREALHRLRNPTFDNRAVARRRGSSSPAGPIDLIRSNTRLRTAGSVMR